MQARLVVRLDDAADPEFHGMLARIDGEHGHPDHDRGQDGDDQQQIQRGFMRRFSATAPSRSRERTAVLVRLRRRSARGPAARRSEPSSGAATS